MQFLRRASIAPPPAAGTPTGADGRPTPAEPGPWGVIWGVGGLCWLVVTGTAVLWMLPTSGTTMDGMYIITNRARTVQHLLVFVAAALAYRLAIALGWPGVMWARARVAVANTLLALSVVAWAPVATALAAGFVESLSIYQHQRAVRAQSPQ